MQQDQSLNQTLALSTVKKGIALNVFLAASKFAAGILGHSAALVSDAVDSASDIFSNLIVMAGIKISHKASDMEHQYGHERMECVASIIMSALLALAGAGIGFAGIQKILHFSAEGELAAPDGIPTAPLKKRTKPPCSRLSTSLTRLSSWTRATMPGRN